MGPILHGLINLQHVENRLRAVKSKLSRSRRSVLFQENQLRTLENGLEAKEEEIKLGRLQVSRLELELKSHDDQISKLRNALNLARTNKEYSIVLTELNTSKADDSKLETQVLELMKNIEADQAAYNAILQQIEEQKAKLDHVRGDTEGKASELEKEIEEIQREWDIAAAKVTPSALSIFKRVAETYDGEAMAEVESAAGNSEIFSCGGCFMGIPAEISNVLSCKDELIRCTNCTRILYLKDHE